MNQEQKEKLIKYVEFVLEPLNGKFVGFDDSTVMYSRIGSVGDRRPIISEENKITIFHMKVVTSNGEIVMSFTSDDLKDLKCATWIACSHSLYGKIISKDNLDRINERFFDLYKNNE